MTSFFEKVIVFLNLPLIPQSTIFNTIGFYAEVVFVITSFLLIINVLLKYPRGEEFFTTWTTFLMILIAVSAAVAVVVYLIPEKVNDSWQRIQPHL